MNYDNRYDNRTLLAFNQEELQLLVRALNALIHATRKAMNEYAHGIALDDLAARREKAAETLKYQIKGYISGA